MGYETGVQWCHHTWNPWRGCTKISPGCTHCYAETLSRRNPAVLGEWGPNGTRVVAAESAWRQPLKWNREAEAAGERRRVFCASLADVFEAWSGPMEDARGVQLWARRDGSWTTSDHYRDTVMLTMEHVRARLLKLIHLTPWLDWQLLTKRPECIRETIHKVADYASNLSVVGDTRDGAELAEQWLLGACMPNVWLGVSVEDQQRADERIPLLLRTPAAVRFVSVEPLLGSVDLMAIKMGCGWRALDCACSAPGCDHETLDWVIVGGESGPQARPCCLDWVRNLVRQCREADVACFVKQLGANVVTRLEPDEKWPGHTSPLSPVEFHGDGFGDYHVSGLKDSKGGSPEEWPEDLRVRQWPEVRR